LQGKKKQNERYNQVLHAVISGDLPTNLIENRH